jgi:hypothetical protein
MSGRATDRMLAFARDIADGLEIELPTTRDADGNEIVDESFDEISAFIEDNKSDFYEWRRENNEW